MPLLAFFVVLPLVEIGLFVTLGAWLGVWTTLALVLASALLGASVIHRQGFVTMTDVRAALQARRDPGRAMAQGALSLLAGGLLILPGFFTSGLGLLLLVPGVRTTFATWATRQMRVRSVFVQGGSEAEEFDRRGAHRPDTIDGDFFEIDATKRPTHRPSGWTRH